VEPDSWSVNWTVGRSLKYVLSSAVLAFPFIVFAARGPRPGDAKTTDATAGAPPSKARFFTDMVQYPAGRLFLAGVGLSLILVGLVYLHAGVRRQVAVSIDESGIDVWRFGRLRHTRWEDVVALTSSRRSRSENLRLVRRRGPTLTIETGEFPGGVEAVRVGMMLWLEYKRPDDWHRIPGLRQSSTHRSSIDW
jgi:hypothetical protein